MKRRIITTCLCLVLGATVNVAVAWGIAVWPSPTAASLVKFRPKGQFQVWGDRTNKFFSIRTGEFSAMEIRQRFTGFSIVHTPLKNDELPFPIPRWSRFKGGRWPVATLIAEGETRDVDYFERACGWPMYAVRYDWIREFDPQLAWLDVTGTHGVVLFPKKLLPDRSSRVVPALPIWPGFAINTGFYAAMLWLLLLGPGKIRRFLRLRRGLCPACAYPIGSSDVCTECGRPVSRQRPVKTPMTAEATELTDTSQDERRCCWCDYDLRAATSAVCPECGREPLDAQELARMRSVCKRWTILGLLIATASTMVMFVVRTAYRPIPAQSHFVGMIVLIGSVAVVGMQRDGQPATAVSTVRRALWLRCSMWLLLPMIVTPLLILGANVVFEIRTRGMPPTVQIAHEWMNAFSWAFISVFASAGAGLALWAWQWFALRRVCGFGNEKPVNSIAAAVVILAIGTLWSAFNTIIAMAGD